MIKTNGQIFLLETDELSYVFHVNESGLLIHDYFGSKITIDDFDISAINKKETCAKGTTVIYDQKEEQLSMETALLEFSFPHKGDFKTTPILLNNASHGYVFDFSFTGYEVKDSIQELEGLPTPHDGDQELVITLKEKDLDVILELHYLLFASANVIARNVVLLNKSNEELHIHKLLSYQLDFINRNFELMSFTGGWATEMHEQIQELKVGKYVHESRTGNSSAKCNPLFVLKEKGASQDCGGTYIFNLIYSGNHIEEVELNTYGNVRVQAGINPFCFDFKLNTDDKFETPFGVMTYSNKGINGARKNMHHFVNNHIIPNQWNNTLRPVVINNWESTMFKFKESSLMKIAKAGKKIGAEMFVLDDGWFSTRNDDSHGLGDYDVNKKKLPHGLKGLAKKVNKIGMQFGLWFEPEAVNPSSKLYEAHPDWAIQCPNSKPVLSRNQLLLDLTKKEVREYIIENVSNILDSANIEYVKWDMNRNMTDIFSKNENGEFFHRYILGLYEVMGEITRRHPKVLFEGCASGGNRFDLGILSYFPQIWTSDCSDAIERLRIQGNISIGYPLSTISAHLSSSPSGQPLRVVPVDTRINVASFGVFGIELIPSEMNKLERERAKLLIEDYKKNRETYQFGDFYVSSEIGDNLIKWEVLNQNQNSAIIGHFNILQRLDAPDSQLKTHGINEDNKYHVYTRPFKHEISKFGGLINVVAPFHVNPNGKMAKLIGKFVKIDSEIDDYVVYGDVLNNGAVTLNPEWSASGINQKVRVLGDFGSRIYYIEKQ